MRQDTTGQGYTTLATQDKTTSHNTMHDRTGPRNTRYDSWTTQLKAIHDKTIQHKTRQMQHTMHAWQYNSRQGKTTPYTTRHHKTRLDKTLRDNATRHKTRQDNAKQDKTRPDKSMSRQGKTNQCNAMQDKTSGTTTRDKAMQHTIRQYNPCYRCQGTNRQGNTRHAGRDNTRQAKAIQYHTTQHKTRWQCNTRHAKARQGKPCKASIQIWRMSRYICLTLYRIQDPRSPTQVRGGTQNHTAAHSGSTIENGV